MEQKSNDKFSREREKSGNVEGLRSVANLFWKSTHNTIQHNTPDPHTMSFQLVSDTCGAPSIPFTNETAKKFKHWTCTKERMITPF